MSLTRVRTPGGTEGGQHYMQRTVTRLRVIAAATSSSLRVVLRRLTRGPTQPTWTWGEEFLVAISRAAAKTTARNVALMTPRQGGPKVPLSRQTRNALTVESTDLDGVPAERYRPRVATRGTILRFHGGGFLSGSSALERRPAAQLAMLTGCDTFGIDYRLAPQHPYPAALDDATTAYRGLLGRGADPSTTVLFGGSAGACLALATLLKIRELELPQPAGAVLLWPYADFTFSGETIATNAEIDMLPVRDLAHVWGPAYVGNANPADPLVSPALADLTGLPPLLIIAGGAESLLSCAEGIAANAGAAHVDTQLTVYPHKVHGWMMLPNLPATVEATNEIVDWIADRLTGPEQAPNC